MHLICTDKRGVFAGTLEMRNRTTITLTDARMCIYWSEETRGVLGLAAHGPAEGSRIGPAVPRIELKGVTAVVEMTEEAAARWRDEPWS